MLLRCLWLQVDRHQRGWWEAGYLLLLPPPLLPPLPLSLPPPPPLPAGPPQLLPPPLPVVMVLVVLCRWCVPTATGNTPSLSGMGCVLVFLARVVLKPPLAAGAGLLLLAPMLYTHLLLYVPMHPLRSPHVATCPLSATAFLPPFISPINLCRSRLLTAIPTSRFLSSFLLCRPYGLRRRGRRT